MRERESHQVNYFERLLSDRSVRQKIAEDLSTVDIVYQKEQWRIGIVEQGQDLVVLTPGEFTQGIGILEQLSRTERLPLKKNALLYPSGTFMKIESLNVTGGGVKQIYPSWSYALDRKPTKNKALSIPEITIRPSALFRQNVPELQIKPGYYPSGMPVPEFLRIQGFPVKDNYTDGNPFHLERGGIITPDGLVHHPDYYLQESLIDDKGDMIYLGINEGSASDDSIKIGPAQFKKLAKYRFRQPALRYHSFPFESETMLPILDTPISASGWADLVISPKSRSRLFVAKEQSQAEWQKMMTRLSELFVGAMRKKQNRLLAFVKDETYLEEYLAEKESILKDYYTIEELSNFN